MPIMLLLIDMHRELSGLLCNYFQVNSKYEIHVVGVAEGGCQAVEMARYIQPNVVMMDEFTLGENIFTVVRKLREMPWLNRPAILVIETACSEKCKKRLTEAGVSGYVCKPFDLERLAAKIQSLCAQNGCEQRDDKI